MYNRLKDLREDNDFTQKHLSEYLSCSQTCYNRYELGSRDIPVSILSLLADLYNTSIDYIVERTDEIKPYSKKSSKKK